MSLGLRHSYRFDSFVVDVEEQVLLRDGRMVPLTPKAFETLLLLVRHQGSIVTKQKILDTLWPNVFVEESNITFNITRLRKALGDTKRQSTYIETVPRRGYRFKSEVEEVFGEGVEPSTNSSLNSTSSHSLPAAQVPFEAAVSRWTPGIRFNRKLTLSLLLIAASVVVVIAAARRLNRNTPVQESSGIRPRGEVSTPNSNPHYEQISAYGNVVSA